MIVLGIETSCDETSAAVLHNGTVLSNIVSSQHCHTSFGGVVPELASREHERLITAITDAAIKEANIQKDRLDVIAATAGPGLIGAIMVGLCFAQGMACALAIPFMPINHIEAHIFSPFIQSSHSTAPLPSNGYISLTVSGGHTLLAHVKSDLSYTIVGKTLDDAAGEAFDKTGKMLGLPYPAGPVIDKLATTGNSNFYHFPRALTSRSRSRKSWEGNLDFSFSGMKTAVLTWLQQQTPDTIAASLPDIAASIQAAIVDVLVEKSIDAAKQYNVNTIAIAGGVSANQGLRKAMQNACQKQGLHLCLPETIYSTDNAAMIASIAALKLSYGATASCRYNIAPYASFLHK